ncbi:hypothetical protein Rumeso_04252 [Rubellimicrobium mesophilum DSM 19309]|uniref:Uncharacterized protein n=1 Tax=Rubellimicrobium mesophilum DSM 19309 TaxID=442562 RepID=A0A017HIP3_9RHOB|nr:hypothetical protein [Rubellimicrobium mesophilum]EYD74195.1 hypothetical protein Rumeso_04252 [Rubellimicrobium mesophilum DSM 19309]
MADVDLGSDADTQASLHSSRGWSGALGSFLLVLGVLAALNLLLAAVVLGFHVGALMILGGIA